MKIKPRPLIIQEHLPIVEKASREIADLERDMTACAGVRADMEQKLLALTPRYDNRQERKNTAYLAAEQAQSAYEQASTYADLATGHSANSQAAQEFLSAEQALKDAKLALLKLSAQLEKEEESDNDQAGRYQATKRSAEVQLAQHSRQMERLQAARTKAIAAHGEQEKHLLDMRFQALADQEQAALQVLEDLRNQKAQLVEESESRLASYPEHLQALRRAHVPFENSVTTLLKGAIVYRSQLLALWHELGIDLDSFCTRHGLPIAYLRAEPVGTRPDWEALDVKDAENWLSRYVKENS